MRNCAGCGSRILPRAFFCVDCGRRTDESNGANPVDILVADAIGANEKRRAKATKSIIDRVDIAAMRRAAIASLELGNTNLAEFWFIEIATAEAEDSIRADGIEDLCRLILLPNLRFAEASLYSRYAAQSQDPFRRWRAIRTLEDIELLWEQSGKERFVFSDEWRNFEARGRSMSEVTEYEHYLGILSFLFNRFAGPELDKWAEYLENDLMQTVTGYVIGFSSSFTEERPERDTLVQALTDWIEQNGLLPSGFI